MPPPLPPDRAHWTRVAAEWTAWARAPGHDAFWSYREGFRAFVGRETGDVLEVGCGEGRIARELTALGHRVTATDPVPAMVEAAAGARSAAAYAVAGADRLPFGDGGFDRVVAYNVLMDVEDVPAAVAEMARVLRRPRGELVVSLVHPFADRGRFEGDGPEAPFVLTGSYFGRQRFETTFARDGLRMRFAGWSQPLEAYVDALARAGLAITALREPEPDDPRGLTGPMRPWTRWPLFLWLKARPLPD
jgi:SAM-dependent methyltransferase